MDRLCAYEIDFKGLGSGKETRHYVVGDDFFAAVEGKEVKQGRVEVDLEIRPTAATFELTFQMKGYVTVECDRCLGDMQLPIDAEAKLRVKLGDENDDDGETITVAEEEGTLNLAWNLYELIALEIPIRHVHPDGECCDGMFDEADEDEVTAEEQPTDPRWDALKAILENNNN